MGYTPPDAIDIGSEVINRATRPSAAGYTLIFKANPANHSGKLTSFELWFDISQGNATGVKVGTFFGSGTSYTSRDVESIGNVTAGSKQTFTGRNCLVEIGDFIGIYYATGDIEFDQDPGGANNYFKVGDQFGTGEQTYAGFTGLASIYGTGSTGIGTLTIGETLSIIDTKTTSGTLAKAETLSIVDTWSALLTFFETLSIIDSKVMSGQLNLDETLSIIDTWSAIIKFFETLSIIDTITTSGSLNLAETLSIVDSWTVLKTFFETLSIADTVAMGGSLNVSEIISIIDSFIRWIEHPIYTEEIKSDVSWIKEVKPTTNWDKEIKVEVGWTKETKPTTDWEKETKPTTDWEEETKKIKLD